ncbi:C69 family dipeptidase [Limosilactobacillus sp.]|uniref:C69 family dipeptidase n=1 Tax=Limosilactobacillus sp. TaxID=2773925 RepID=UPI00345ECDF4
MSKHKIQGSSCTAILVGKCASMDGSTIIARDEDGYDGINPKKFVVIPAKNYDGVHYVSKYNGFECDLHGDGARYTSTPNGNEDQGMKGIWGEQGINQYNVAMSSTETELTNPRCLGHDPLVKNGVDEDSMFSIVMPFIKTPREGVELLGKYIEKYGTGESNGIAFSNKDEIWYFETAAGHHWAAERIPDDCYAICPNIMCIEDFDFNDPDHFLCDPDLKDFVERHHLNPNPGTFNFRNIFGSQNEADSTYNTPRTWYGQKLFNPSIEQDPTSQDIPWLRKPEKKIAIEDVQYFLSSHYNGTKYDPFDTFASGDKKDMQKFRPIALDRNQESSILQIRNDVPAEYAAIQWIDFGFYAYSPYVPFYTNINDTPTNYKTADEKFDINSAYWMHKLLEVVVEPRYHDYINEVNAFRDGCQSYGVGRVDEIDAKAAKLSGQELQDFLTRESIATADHISDKTRELLDSLIHHTLLNSKYQYELGDNL